VTEPLEQRPRFSHKCPKVITWVGLVTGMNKENKNYLKIIFFEFWTTSYFPAITTPHVLTRALYVQEAATIESLQKAECVLQHARQNHIENFTSTVIKTCDTSAHG
jgi:hypothetical protein